MVEKTTICCLDISEIENPLVRKYEDSQIMVSTFELLAEVKEIFVGRIFSLTRRFAFHELAAWLFLSIEKTKVALLKKKKTEAEATITERASDIFKSHNVRVSRYYAFQISICSGFSYCLLFLSSSTISHSRLIMSSPSQNIGNAWNR